MADIAIINPVFALEASGNSGSTHKAVLKHSDLTQAAANQTLTIPINAAAADVKQVEVIAMRLTVPFEDKSDAAFNDLTVICGWPAGSATGTGDLSTTHTNAAAAGSVDVNGFMRSAQLNANGTPVMFMPGTGVRVLYNVAAKHIDVYVATATGGKTVDNIDKGELEIWVRILGAQD